MDVSPEGPLCRQQRGGVRFGHTAPWLRFPSWPLDVDAGASLLAPERVRGGVRTRFFPTWPFGILLTRRAGCPGHKGTCRLPPAAAPHAAAHGLGWKLLCPLGDTDRPQPLCLVPPCAGLSSVLS